MTTSLSKPKPLTHAERGRMGLPAGRCGAIMDAKPDTDPQGWCDAHGYDESWAIIDGAVVIYNMDSPPSWIPERDEDGNSKP